MSGLHHSVLTAFGISGAVKEKGYYKTSTKIIRKTKDMREQIMAKHQVFEHCKGYPWLERYHLSKSGQPYAYANGEHYIMTDLIRYREADFSDSDEFLKIVGSVAQWHRCARNIELSAPLQRGRKPSPLTDTFQKQIELMDSVLKRIRKQSGKYSDFDVLFIKSCPEYRERISKAHTMLTSTGYESRFQTANDRNHICHGGLKEDCIRVSGDLVYITNLESAVVDYQLNDLCALIRRREKLNLMLDRERIIEAYCRVLPIDPEEEIILEAMLLYPQAFVKLVSEYYQKKRTWTPVAMANKMQEVLNV